MYEDDTQFILCLWKIALRFSDPQSIIYFSIVILIKDVFHVININ